MLLCSFINLCNGFMRFFLVVTVGAFSIDRVSMVCSARLRMI